MTVSIAAPVVFFVGSVAALLVTGQNRVVWADVGRSGEYPTLQGGVYWALNVLRYGFGEEVGWRGFALPRLQVRRSALTSRSADSDSSVVARKPVRRRS